MAQKTVSLVIPAYNEEQRIVTFLASIAEYAKNSPGNITEVIVVDDGSSDATSAVGAKAGTVISGFRVIQHDQNQGKGAAVQTGVLEARGDYFIFMDQIGPP